MSFEVSKFRNEETKDNETRKQKLRKLGEWPGGTNLWPRQVCPSVSDGGLLLLSLAGKNYAPFAQENASNHEQLSICLEEDIGTHKKKCKLTDEHEHRFFTTQH